MRAQQDCTQVTGHYFWQGGVVDSLSFRRVGQSQAMGCHPLHKISVGESALSEGPTAEGTRLAVTCGQVPVCVSAQGGPLQVLCSDLYFLMFIQ